jgi:uncharacterized protein (DUF736 family)
MLTETTKAQGALFSIADGDRTPNGPLMTGNVEHNSVKINLTAFLKTSRDTGLDYLNLRVGDPRKDDPVFYGRLFRNTDKREANSPDYTGYIEITSEKDGPTLRISGWKKRSRKSSVQFISLEISPREAQTANEDGASSEVPF